MGGSESDSKNVASTVHIPAFNIDKIVKGHFSNISPVKYTNVKA